MRTALLSLALLAACGGPTPPEPPATPATPPEQPEAPAKPATPPATPPAEPATPASQEADAPKELVTVEGDKVRIHLEASDAMKFNASRIEVPAGTEITLTLQHTGQLPVEAMGHNFVLLEAGSDLAAFGSASMVHKDKGYIAPDKADQVIAHTEVIGGGNSTTITFKAPEAGEYPFLCSFPGHYSAMKGVFVVK